MKRVAHLSTIRCLNGASGTVNNAQKRTLKGFMRGSNRALREQKDQLDLPEFGEIPEGSGRKSRGDLKLALWKELRDLRQRIDAIEAMLKLDPEVAIASVEDPILLIQKVVADVCEVDPFEVYDEPRGRQCITWARHLGMYLCYELSLGTDDQLSTRFNRLNPSTVGHGRGVAKNGIEIDKRLRAQYDECKSRLSKLLPPQYQEALNRLPKFNAPV